MAPSKVANPTYYFAASGCSALAFFPLWKAAAIGQSGYAVAGQGYWMKYLQAMKPPWRGSLAVIGGMTWARASIFYGSDIGSGWMRSQGFGTGISATVPSLVVSMFAQTVNQPFVRTSIMLQNPGEELASRLFPNAAMLKHLVNTKGVMSLWTGLDAAILKTVPKYMVAVVIKDYMGEWLAPVDPTDKRAVMLKSAKVSVTAGVAGAVLTNPLDVVRNEMFKTEEGMVPCMVRMSRESGVKWFARGIGKNWVAVAAPIASTIFLTDRFRVWFGAA
uniref:Mitochondrial carrier protein n=1 Tax=Alexandrium monilatum TaxID=311494 RepID=A0A7S4QUA9_9DINO